MARTRTIQIPAITGGPCELPPFLSDDPDLARLYDNVMAQVPGVTTDMIALVAWNTIQDFYQRTTYRREHVYWRMDSGVYTLNFDPWDNDWRTFRFLWFRGPDNFKFEPPGRIRDLNATPPPSTRNGEILLALKPESLATKLPYDVWTMWFECLQAGMMYRLCMQPGKPYSNMQSAHLYGVQYVSGCAGARALVQANNITDGASWRYPLFAPGRVKNS
jgi:hypothetical protein